MHLSAIDGMGDDNIKQTFLLLALRSLEIVARSGDPRPAIGELTEMVSMAKKQSGW